MAPLPVKEGRCRQVAAEGSVLPCSQGPGSVCRWELSPLAPRPSFQVNIWRNVLSGVRGTRERVFFPKDKFSLRVAGTRREHAHRRVPARTHSPSSAPEPGRPDRLSPWRPLPWSGGLGGTRGQGSPRSGVSRQKTGAPAVCACRRGALGPATVTALLLCSASWWRSWPGLPGGRAGRATFGFLSDSDSFDPEIVPACLVHLHAFLTLTDPGHPVLSVEGAPLGTSATCWARTSCPTRTRGTDGHSADREDKEAAQGSEPFLSVALTPNSQLPPTSPDTGSYLLPHRHQASHIGSGQIFICGMNE